MSKKDQTLKRQDPYGFNESFLGMVVFFHAVPFRIPHIGQYIKKTPEIKTNTFYRLCIRIVQAICYMVDYSQNITVFSEEMS
jgi:hypothetical protein